MYQVRSAKVILNVEVIENGKLTGVKEVPVQLFESQFNRDIESLVVQLLAQVNGSPEVKPEPAPEVVAEG